MYAGCQFLYCQIYTPSTRYRESNSTDWRKTGCQLFILDACVSRMRRESRDTATSVSVRNKHVPDRTYGGTVYCCTPTCTVEDGRISDYMESPHRNHSNSKDRSSSLKRWYVRFSYWYSAIQAMHSLGERTALQRIPSEGRLVGKGRRDYQDYAIRIEGVEWGCVSCMYGTVINYDRRCGKDQAIVLFQALFCTLICPSLK